MSACAPTEGERADEDDGDEEHERPARRVEDAPHGSVPVLDVRERAFSRTLNIQHLTSEVTIGVCLVRATGGRRLLRVSHPARPSVRVLQK